MWEWIKNVGKGILRRMGLIDHLKKLDDHKRIIVDNDEYFLIQQNKDLYSGYYKDWHHLEYLNSHGSLVRRKQMTMGLPKVISERLASLLFNEGVDIDVSEDLKKDAQWEIVKNTITSNKFKREFQRYLEYMFAMGGIVLEVYRDGEEIKIAYATADAVFPTSRDSENIDEVIIANQFVENGHVYTLLKEHSWLEDTYQVKNELYESKVPGEIGDKVPLSRLFPDMESEILFENLRRSLFVYLKPNIANNKFISSPLGLSTFENAKDTIRMIDVMYDFWYQEFRLGKRRVAVPQFLVKQGIGIDGRPYNYIDDSEELFVALNSGEMDEMEMKDLTVDLRVDQITESIQAMLDILSLQVGLSPGTFTFKGGGLKTATQVASENSETMRTRASHLSVIEDGLRDLIVTIYDVATLDENIGLDPLEREDISIDFNDGIFQDKDAQLDFYLKLHKAGLVPSEKVLEAVLGLSEDDAIDWVDKIQSERVRQDSQLDEAINDVLLNGRLER